MNAYLIFGWRLTSNWIEALLAAVIELGVGRAGGHEGQQDTDQDNPRPGRQCFERAGHLGCHFFGHGLTARSTIRYFLSLYTLSCKSMITLHSNLLTVRLFCSKDLFSDNLNVLIRDFTYTGAHVIQLLSSSTPFLKERNSYNYLHNVSIANFLARRGQNSVVPPTSNSLYWFLISWRF